MPIRILHTADNHIGLDVDPARAERAFRAVIDVALAERVHAVIIAGDGQVTLGHQIVKHNARKVRRLADGRVIAGFAGATADAFTLFERLEAKLERHPGQLLRACIELAKDWRTDRYLRRLEAMMIVADAKVSLVLTGTGVGQEHLAPARRATCLRHSRAVRLPRWSARPVWVHSVRWSIRRAPSLSSP